MRVVWRNPIQLCLPQLLQKSHQAHLPCTLHSPGLSKCFMQLSLIIIANNNNNHLQISFYPTFIQYSQSFLLNIMLSVVDRASVWSSRGWYCDHYHRIKPGPESRGHWELCFHSWSAMYCYSHKIWDLLQVNYTPANPYLFPSLIPILDFF